MHPKTKKGARIGLVIYGIGIIISFIMYFTIENTYIHGPGPHQIVLILLFYMAIIWCIISLLLALFKIRRQLQLGFLIVNGSYLFCCLLFALYVIIKY